jgi:hypothetical protein
MRKTAEWVWGFAAPCIRDSGPPWGFASSWVLPGCPQQLQVSSSPTNEVARYLLLYYFSAVVGFVLTSSNWLTGRMQINSW